MSIMKNEVLIYDKNKETLEFLRRFFRRRDDYSATFIKDKKTLLKTLKKDPNVIVSSPDVFEKNQPRGCKMLCHSNGVREYHQRHTFCHEKRY